MFDLLTLALAVVIFFGPLVSAVSLGIRGHQQAMQRQAHPLPLIVLYSLLGLIVGGIVSSIILILAEGSIGSKNISLKQKICTYYTGGSYSTYCDKYKK